MGKAHSNAYAQAGHFYELPYRIRRTLLCGRDAAALATMAERWGWEETTTDWRTTIDRNDIDAVDISLPNHLHAPVAIAAAAAGKIVMCEKPLALTVDEAVAMADAAKNVRTMVWFNYRRVPAIAYAKQLIDEGRLGTILSLRCRVSPAVGCGLVARRDVAHGPRARRVRCRRRSPDPPARHGALSERADDRRRCDNAYVRTRIARSTMRFWRW